MIRALALGAVLVAVGCKSNAVSSDDPDLKVTTEPPKGSAGGFSASLEAELGMGSGSGSDSDAGSGAGSGAGSAAGSDAGSGSAAGSGSDSGSASGSAAGSGSTGTGKAPAAPVSPELAAIKLSLLPNWDRDVEEPGTISLFVKVQRTGQSELFKFYYGYEDPSAPADREAYKKFLTETKVLKVVTDRQRGTAWLLEGHDSSGGPAFRIVVLYGGKRLVCYGSQYKDSTLGDFRDEVILQARKICESISL